MRVLVKSFAFLLALTLEAAAQGCGLQNPNCIVPTAPLGASDNRAASTAFVQRAVAGGSGTAVINNMPAYTYPCNNTNINGAPVTACYAYNVSPPLFLNTSTNSLSLNASSVNFDTYAGIDAGLNAPTISGGSNTGFGAFALLSVNGGSGNAAFGFDALIDLTTGVNNIGIGAALSILTTGSGNVGIGPATCGGVTTAMNNICIGADALNKGNGNNNTAIGELALADQTTASNNIGIGPSAGRGITTGSNNTIIGGCAGLSATLASALVFCDGAGNVQLDYGLTTAGAWTGGGFVATAAAPTVAAAQIGYGSTIVAAGSGTCPTGTVGGATVLGCIVVNIAGTARNVPYF